MPTTRSTAPTRSRAWKWLLATGACAALLASCTGPGVSVTVTLDPATLDLILGGSGTVQVTVTRSTAATSPLSLQAEGNPDWVDVSFAPATLTGATLESTMTLMTDAEHPDASAGSFDVTVQVVGAGVTAQATLTVTVELLTVNGTVVDAYGAPLPGLNVVVSGHAGTVTDGSGAFTVSGVTIPYDLLVVDTVASVGHQFVGLTTGAPRVLPISTIVGGVAGSLSATVTGNLSHATLIPLPAGHGGMVCVEGLDGAVSGCDTLAPGESSYSIVATWPTPTNVNARVRAYVYTVDANDNPTAMVAAGTAGPTPMGDSDTPVLDVTLSDTSSQASLTVTTSTPAGYDLDGRAMASHYSDFASIRLPNGAPVGSTGTVLAPFFPAANLTGFATASASVVGSSSVSIAWSTGHSSGDSVSLTLPSPATVVSPPEGASGVNTSTTFEVANPAGGVLTFLLQPSGTGPVLAVTTVSTTARFPDLASFGMGLPGAAAYFWGALTTHHISTVDEAVTGEGYFGAYLNLNLAVGGAGAGPQASGQISSTDTSDVTTQ